jgi:hypothetical protein
VQTQWVYRRARLLNSLNRMEIEAGQALRAATVVDSVAVKPRVSRAFNTEKFLDVESKGVSRDTPGRAPGPEPDSKPY